MVNRVEFFPSSPLFSLGAASGRSFKCCGSGSIILLVKQLLVIWRSLVFYKRGAFHLHRSSKEGNDHGPLLKEYIAISENPVVSSKVVELQH